MSNGCPVCYGVGRLLVFAGFGPLTVVCPECAGLEITPASADRPPVAVLRQRMVRASTDGQPKEAETDERENDPPGLRPGSR